MVSSIEYRVSREENRRKKTEDEIVSSIELEYSDE